MPYEWRGDNFLAEDIPLCIIWHRNGALAKNTLRSYGIRTESITTVLLKLLAPIPPKEDDRGSF